MILLIKYHLIYWQHLHALFVLSVLSVLMDSLLMVNILVDKIPDLISHISQHAPLTLLFVRLVTGSHGHRIQAININSQISNLSDTGN